MTSRKRRRPPRGWTLILVPPRPGARTRQVTVTTRSLATAGLIALGFVTAAATWTGENSLIAADSADRLASTQRTVVALLDSVAALHSAVVRDSRLPPRQMMMPVSGEISSPFSVSRFHPILGLFRAHLGVDLSAPSGTPIVASGPARVRSVGWRLAYGLTIELEHNGGVVTRYAHCRSAKVHAGDVVAEGDVIGTVGSSGLATGPHVHFEVLINGSQVDPIKYLAASRAGVHEAAPGADH
jgi:murein DD-endopeptidase MepM/ murein hydrolase activator NlpD